MTTKREMLTTLTREQLKELASQYSVPFEHSWTKDHLVAVLASSHTLTIDGVEALLTRISSTGSAASAVRSERQDWYQTNVVPVFQGSDTINSRLSEAISLMESVAPGFITEMLARTTALKTSSLVTRDAPDHVWTQLTIRQKSAVRAASNLCRQIPNQMESCLKLATQAPGYLALMALRSRGLPPRIEYYALQAHRAHASRCYDASVVMLARALENLLKHHLALKGKKHRDQATLGELVGVYKSQVGENAVLQKILEVSNLDRIISAHDVAPYYREMQAVDSEHAWSAFEIVLRELPPR